MNYDIKPKPTQYKGRLYRSRLEARYAAMYDLLNVKFEYEPFDLCGWSPDFLLSLDDKKVLVEVKPINDLRELDRDYLERLVMAVKGSDYWLVISGLDNEMFVYQKWPFVFNSEGVNLPDFSVFLPRPDLSLKHQGKWIEAANVVQFLKPF